MTDDLVIRPLDGDDEAWTCADLMASTDPWITLGRTREMTQKLIADPRSTPYVAVSGGEIVGLIIIATGVPLLGGYIRTVVVRTAHRNRGIGAKLLAFAEERLFRESANVFLCVSSFNPDAQRFYERLGYQRIGELTDFIIEGAAEILMRKTLGPVTKFKPA